MSNILIDQIRISGFRGLKDFKMPLKRTTVLIGVNNVGKTSILKALQLALGNRSFLEHDDFYRSQDGLNISDTILVDIRIVSANERDERLKEFSSQWEELLLTDKIKYDSDGYAYIPLRTIVKHNIINDRFIFEQKILNYWDASNISENWKDINGNKKSFSLDEIMFFYQEAQRDVVDDIKLKSSFLGKMLSHISNSYDSNELNALEDLMKELNDITIEKSNILPLIKESLGAVGAAMNSNENIDITPFAKKIRDINKSIAITYGGEHNSLTMDFHGMGTRSWTSILTLKAFLLHNQNLSNVNNMVFFPIVAIEEPEAHLHPNAQKKLYKQLSEMPGQKIISTHSQYIAASSEIEEVFVLSKNNDTVKFGCINKNILSSEDLRKIRHKVINTKGEVYFSKALVLFEGETEEQALPIFAHKYFDYDPSEFGIDFVGVGGAGQYLPFIRFADNYNIPWYIFSDGEISPVNDMTNSVKTIRGDEFTTIENEKNVFVIKDGDDFEKYICKSHFAEIRDYYKNKVISECDNEHKKTALDRDISRWTESKILEKAKEHKTQWALIFADAVVNSTKELPSLIVEMFLKIKTDLSHE